MNAPGMTYMSARHGGVVCEVGVRDCLASPISMPGNSSSRMVRFRCMATPTWRPREGGRGRMASPAVTVACHLALVIYRV